MPITTSLRARHLLLASLIAGAVAPSVAQAQAIVGPADASRVQDRIARPQISQMANDLVSVEGPPVVAAPAGADKISLTLQAVNLEGATLYAPDALSAAYADKVGQKITVADVYKIAAEITRQYRNDGYILTQVVVPPQTIDNGNVRLLVVEGVIGNVTIEGVDKESERKLIQSYADQLKDRPLKTSELEKAILLINDLPGVSARAVISPSDAKVGAADMRVVVKRERMNWVLGMDNFGSRYLGPLEGQASWAGNSLLGHNDRVVADLIYAPGGGVSRELAYGGLTFTQPIGPFGTTIELKAGYAATDPGFKLAQYDVNGYSTTASLGVNQPIIRTRALNLSTYGLFDVRNNKTQSNIAHTTQDNVRALRLGTKLDFIDSFMSIAYTTMSAEIGQGISAFGASDNNDANLSRARGNPQFTKLNVEVQRLQRLTSDINLLVGVKGQLSNDALLSSEEFGVGGPNYGRGFDPSEVTGDDGVAGKVELQLSNPFETTLVRSHQFYAFLDAGSVWNEDATTSADQHMNVISTGLGVRTTLNTGTDAGLYVALPLRREVEALGNQDPRVYFNLNQKF